MLQLSDSAINALTDVGKKSVDVLKTLANGGDADLMNDKALAVLECQAGASDAVANAQAQEVSIF